MVVEKDRASCQRVILRNKPHEPDQSDRHCKGDVYTLVEVLIRRARVSTVIDAGNTRTYISCPTATMKSNSEDMRETSTAVG